MRSALVVALLAVPVVAEAHIKLMVPTARPTDNLGDPQKTPDCGGATNVRDPARVSTFKPGQTIDITFRETINHTGWFRVSFQPSGQTFFIPPAGQGPPANFPNDATGTTDATTGTIVLMDRITDTPTINVDTTVQVTLPNMECDNCTLQFMQVMTNDGTYNGDPDLYFNCADITLANDAPDAGAQVGGGEDAGLGEGSGSNGQDPGKVSGGCAASPAGAGLVLSLLGLAGLRRRRRA